MNRFTGKYFLWFWGGVIFAIGALAWAWPLWNEDTSNLVLSEILEMNGNRFTISLPDYGVAYEWRRSDTGIEFIFFPEFRTPRTLSIRPADLSISQQLDQVARGPNGLVLDFHIEAGAGGSGGAEFFLYGVLRSPKGAFDVFCSIQGELILEKSARWCIPALHSLAAIN